MNKEEIIKALDNLIEDFSDYSTDYTKSACIFYKEIFNEIKHQLEEKEEQINIMSEAFDELKHQKQDYTQINILEMKLEEKDKVIDEAIDYMDKNVDDNLVFNASELFKILERGKNVNNK